jgi:DNA-binding response OmpR family regulator
MILPRTTILEVLLAHPHPASTRALQQALRGRGHAPVTVSSIDETEERLHGARWDGVVVSAAFGLEAAAFLHRTRRAGRTLPIAALVEACSTAKQVALLDEGFDQVFESSLPEEVALRLEALVRRSWHRSALRRIDCGGLVVDEGRSVVETPEGEFCLAPNELRVFVLLAERTGRIVPRAELITVLAGELGTASDNALESIIKRLRKKAGIRERLLSVRLQGYILTPPPS